MPDAEEAPAWQEDRWRDRNRIRSNIYGVIRGIADDAHARWAPTADMAKQWHRDIYAGVRVPVPCYVGTFRGDPACPELLRYGVEVGIHKGAKPSDVESAIYEFEEQMRRSADMLDPLVPVDLPPQTTEELQSAIYLAAAAHGEWVRIHPFANGNGRTARLWANWVALRYGLPPFIRLKPRPAGRQYEVAAAASMQKEKDHNPTAVLFMDWLTEYFRGTTVR